MTTIAFDGKTIACDSQISCGGSFSGVTNKIIPLGGADFICCCGNMEDWKLVADYFRLGGEKPSLDEGFSCVGYIRGDWFECRDNLVPIKPPLPIFLGSGAVFAQGAYAGGLGMEESVAAACKVDLYSCLPVRSRSINNDNL